MAGKKELVHYADIGLYGTFVRFIEKSSEENYVYLEYVPLNSFPPKKKILRKAIHKDHIHTVRSASNEPGVEETTIMIFTNEPGSVVANVLQSDSEKLISELRERVRKLQMQVASSKQNEEDARSGVSKVISSMKSVTKPVENRNDFDLGGFPRDRFGQTPQRNEQSPYEFEDF